jgi:hypothetical protein
LLVQRPAAASLMAAMWELPSLSETTNGTPPIARFRHSITDTDYEISVVALTSKRLQQIAKHGRWFGRGQWQRLPLTGLARKILRKLRA